jgi:hypothetical protein
MLEGKWGGVVGAGTHLGGEGDEPLVLLLIGQTRPSPGVCQTVGIRPDDARVLAAVLVQEADRLAPLHRLWKAENDPER